MPSDLDELRHVVQGLVLHRDWAPLYGFDDFAFACVNKVELLPWDSWGMLPDPYVPLTDEAIARLTRSDV